MNPHIDTQWMDPYLDGELSTAQRRQADAHLVGCPACRAALERRRALSGMLLAVPPALQGKSAQRFADEVARQMQSAPARTPAPSHPWLRAAWVAVPVALLAVFTFFQATALLTNLIVLFPGLSGALSATLAPDLPFAGGLALPAPLDGLVQFISLVAAPQLSWITALVAPIAFGLLYLSWLAGWWATQHAPRADFVEEERMS